MVYSVSSIVFFLLFVETLGPLKFKDTTPHHILQSKFYTILGKC